jgi:hypothetical protein
MQCSITEKKTRVTTFKTKLQNRLRLQNHVQGAGVAPFKHFQRFLIDFVPFVNACGVRNHEVANAVDVAVSGRCANIMFSMFFSDARDGSILQNHER